MRGRYFDEINHMLTYDRPLLNEWETKFLTDIRNKMARGELWWLSKKQKAKFLQIFKEVDESYYP